MCAFLWQHQPGLMSSFEAEWYGMAAYHANYLTSSDATRSAVVANNAGVIRATGHGYLLDFDMAHDLLDEAHRVCTFAHTTRCALVTSA